MALPEPVEKFGIGFHSRICRAKGVDPQIKSRTERQNVTLTAVNEFLHETQSEVGCHAIHSARRERERHTE